MRKIFVVAPLLLAFNVQANNSVVNAGSAMTLGPSSSSSSLTSSSYNPAMNALVLSKGDNLRLSYFPTFGFNVEIGDLDNFSDDLEELADIIDDAGNTNEEPSIVLSRFNKVLNSAGEAGYVKFNSSINAPLLPLYFYSKMLKGTVGFDYAINAQAGLSLLDAELSYNNQNESFSTASALYLKSGIEQTFSLSFGQEVYRHKMGKLYAGGKLKYINIELSKQVLPLVELAGEELNDLIQDEYDENQESSGDFGLDFGLVWDASHYRIGLTLENINSPEFEYGEIGINCTDISENTPSRSNCESAKYFSQTLGEIRSKEVHKKDPVLRLDGIIELFENFSVSSALDLAKYNDMIGDKHQWFHAAVNYNPGSLLIPSLRAGFHKNLTGEKVSSLTAGITVFNIVSLDVEYGLNRIEIDNTTAPRRFGFSISIQEQF